MPRSRPPSRLAPGYARTLGAVLASIATTAMATEAGPYPVSVRIAEPGGAHVRYTRAPGTTSTWPPEPSGTADLTGQAQAAYAAAAARMFRAAGAAGADLELAVSVAAADVDSRSSGSTASVEHDVVLRAPAGELLGEWRVRGEHSFVATGEGSMETAFERAARDAAEELEARFEEPPAVAAWLRARNIPPRATDARVRSRPERIRPRGFFAAFLELSGGAMTGSYDVSSIDTAQSQDFALGVRAGLTGGRFEVALSFSRWRSAFEDSRPYPQWALDADSNAVGLEIGPRYLTRFGLEAHGGVGLHLITTSTRYQDIYAFASHPPESNEESHVAGSLFGALGYSRCGDDAGWCFGAGVELRGYLGATLDALPMNAARFSAAGYLRVEPRLDRPPSRSAPTPAAPTGSGVATPTASPQSAGR